MIDTNSIGDKYFMKGTLLFQINYRPLAYHFHLHYFMVYTIHLIIKFFINEHYLETNVIPFEYFYTVVVHEKDHLHIVHPVDVSTNATGFG